MSTQAVLGIVSRAIVDADFRELLLSAPESALAGHELTQGERASLEELSPERLHACAGRLVVHKLLPIRVGRRLLIVPARASPSRRPRDVLIRLDQDRSDALLKKDGTPFAPQRSSARTGIARAFGSGLHPTTRLCLKALEDHLRPGEDVLDLGTGTGILAIAAAKLGAASVLALDVDEGAVGVAREHVAMNDVGDIVRVERGSVERLVAHPQDAADFAAHVVVANIATPVIVDLLRNGLVNTLRARGLVIASGIMADDTPSVVDAMEAAGLEVVARRRLAGWTAVISRRDIRASPAWVLPQQRTGRARSGTVGGTCLRRLWSRSSASSHRPMFLLCAPRTTWLTWRASLRPS